MGANESMPEPPSEPPSKKRKKGIPCLDLNGPDYLNSFYIYAEMDKWSDHCLQKIQELSKDTDTHGLEVCRALHRMVLYYKVMERDIAEAKEYARSEEARKERLAAQSHNLSATVHESPQSPHSSSRRTGDTSLNGTEGGAVEGEQGSSQSMAERERQTPLTVPQPSSPSQPKYDAVASAAVDESAARRENPAPVDLLGAEKYRAEMAEMKRKEAELRKIAFGSSKEAETRKERDGQAAARNRERIAPVVLGERRDNEPLADGPESSLAGKSTVVQPVESGVTGKESSEQMEKEKERMQRESSLMVVRRVVPRTPAIPPVRQCKVEMRVEGEEERRESATTTETSAESNSHHEQRGIPDDETTREVPTIRVKQETDGNPFVVPALPSALLRDSTPPRLVIKTEPQTPPPAPSHRDRSASSSTEKKKKKKKKATETTDAAEEAAAARAAAVAAIPPPPPPFNFDVTPAAAAITPPSYSLTSTPHAAPFPPSPSFSLTSTAAAAASFSSPSRSVAYNTSAFVTPSPSFSSTAVAAAAAEQPSFGASHLGAERATQEQLTELSTQILHVNSIKQEAIQKGVLLGHLAIPLPPISDGSRDSMDMFNIECRSVAEEARSLDMKFDSLRIPPDDYLRVNSQTVRRAMERIWKGGRGEGSKEHMATEGQRTMSGQGMANPVENSIQKLFKIFVDTEPAAAKNPEEERREKRTRPDSILPAERSTPPKKRRMHEKREGERRESDDEPSTSRGRRHKETRGRGESTWCAFCQSKTSHHAINCSVYKTNLDRQQRLRQLKLCYHCLEKFLPSSCMRPDHMKKCTHCHSHSSHPAMCKFLNQPPGRRGPAIPHHSPYKRKPLRRN